MSANHSPLKRPFDSPDTPLRSSYAQNRPSQVSQVPEIMITDSAEGFDPQEVNLCAFELDLPCSLIPLFLQLHKIFALIRFEV